MHYKLHPLEIFKNITRVPFLQKFLVYHRTDTENYDAKQFEGGSIV